MTTIEWFLPSTVGELSWSQRCRLNVNDGDVDQDQASSNNISYHCKIFPALNQRSDVEVLRPLSVCFPKKVKDIGYI
jgi:hypothetical protein